MSTDQGGEFVSEKRPLDGVNVAADQVANAAQWFSLFMSNLSTSGIDVSTTFLGKEIKIHIDFPKTEIRSKDVEELLKKFISSSNQ